MSYSLTAKQAPYKRQIPEHVQVGRPYLLCRLTVRTMDFESMNLCSSHSKEAMMIKNAGYVKKDILPVYLQIV